MKKLFLISVLCLVWSGSVYSEIINLNNCYSTFFSNDKTWNKNSKEIVNTLYYKWNDKNSRSIKEDGRVVNASIGGEIADNLKELEEVEKSDLYPDGYKKIKMYEQISITIDKKYITFLTIYTDEYVDFEQKNRKLMLEWFQTYGKTVLKEFKFITEKTYKREFYKRDVQKYLIEDYFSQFIYGVREDDIYPDRLNGIEINLENLVVTLSESLNLLKNGGFFTDRKYICNKNNSDGGEEASGSCGTAFFIN